MSDQRIIRKKIMNREDNVCAYIPGFEREGGIIVVSNNNYVRRSGKDWIPKANGNEPY